MNPYDLDRHITGNYGEDYWPEELTQDPAEDRAGCPAPPVADEDVAEPELDEECRRYLTGIGFPEAGEDADA